MILSCFIAVVLSGRLKHERRQSHEDIGLLNNLGTHLGHTVPRKKRVFIRAITYFHIDDIILVTDGFRRRDRLT
jgi:hypothetical protein